MAKPSFWGENSSCFFLLCQLSMSCWPEVKVVKELSYQCIFQVLVSCGLVSVMPSLGSLSPYDSRPQLNVER